MATDAGSSGESRHVTGRAHKVRGVGVPTREGGTVGTTDVTTTYPSCCRWHNANCADIEEACCEDCPTWVDVDREYVEHVRACGEPDYGCEHGRLLNNVVMKALTATGHYEETPDSFEWLTREALDVAAIITEYGAYPESCKAAIRAHLADTGLHDETDPDERQCLHRDAQAIYVAASSGGPSEADRG